MLTASAEPAFGKSVTVGAGGPPRYDPRTPPLIDGPVALTLLRLATPNMLVMLAQASVRLVETYFVGELAPYPLAGVALVFPVVMLMQMMSSGAVGAAGFLRRS